MPGTTTRSPARKVRPPRSARSRRRTRRASPAPAAACPRSCDGVLAVPVATSAVTGTASASLVRAGRERDGTGAPSRRRRSGRAGARCTRTVGPAPCSPGLGDRADRADPALDLAAVGQHDRDRRARAQRRGHARVGRRRDPRRALGQLGHRRARADRVADLGRVRADPRGPVADDQVVGLQRAGLVEVAVRLEVLDRRGGRRRSSRRRPCPGRSPGPSGCARAGGRRSRRPSRASGRGRTGACRRAPSRWPARRSTAATSRAGRSCPRRAAA